MKVNFKNSLINDMPLEYYGKLKQNKAEINTNKDYNKERPAQAISFSGSASSVGEKFVENKYINGLADYVKKNEAGFVAILVLILSGIIKPFLVLNSKGSDEKDKQLIATKNFIQAFIGFFLSKTIAGGVVNKAVRKIQDDLSLISIDKEGKLIYETAESENAKEIAKNLLIKENSGIKDRLKIAKRSVDEISGFKKVSEFIKSFRKKVDYKPSQEDIAKKATDVIKDFASKRKQIFEQNPEFVKKIISHALPDIKRSGSKTTFYEAYESFWKNSTGWITAILKAKITSAILPTVTAFLFANRAIKNLKDKKYDEILNSPLLNNNQFKKENEKFKLALNKTTKPLSFKGNLINSASDTLAKSVEKISMTKTGENFVTKLAKFKKPSPRMADLESFIITGYWLQNTARSKKIEPDQKLGLNIQTALVTAVAFVSSLFIDWMLDKPMQKVKGIYKDKLSEYINDVKQEVQNGTLKNTQKDIEDALKARCINLAGKSDIAKTISRIDMNDTAAIGKQIERLTEGYDKKVGKLKSLAIFTLIVRFLIPILMVPIGGKIKNQIKKWQEQNKEKDVKKA